MKVSGRGALIGVLCGLAGVLLLMQEIWTGPHSKAARADVRPSSPTATATVSPSPTATLPPASDLLSLATGTSAAKRSVLEYGSFRSTNDQVFDGFHFGASLAWQRDTFRDWHTFAKPVFLNKDVGYALSVRRFAMGPWLATKVHGTWSCRRQTPQMNSALWQPPTFSSLQTPVTVGQTTLSGQPAWHIRGQYVHRFKGQKSQLTVDVFVSEGSGVYLKASEVGTIKTARSLSASINGIVNYGDYARPVRNKLPEACKG